MFGTFIRHRIPLMGGTHKQTHMKPFWKPTRMLRTRGSLPWFLLQSQGKRIWPVRQIPPLLQNKPENQRLYFTWVGALIMDTLYPY